jgi:copper(I)-binding protein
MNLTSPRLLLASILCVFAAVAGAHGFQAGDVKIDHPYARPSLTGASNGSAYLKLMENTGSRPDRLLRVSTPVAERAELHTMGVDDGGVMRMREVPAIDLAPGQPVAMQPGMGLHVMLMGLKQPLRDGESFPMTLEFERAGKVEVKVVVQQPKDGAASAAGHRH